MYKLLLATDQRDIQNVFSEIDDWESRGFRGPRVVSSAQEAIACLEKHHVDAIAFCLKAQEEAELYQKLKESYPDLPIFQTARNAAKQLAIVNDLRLLLNRTHLDFSNDDYSLADMMTLCRHEFMHNLLAGQISDTESALSKMSLLRCRFAADKPCVLLDMELPQGDEYLAGRWHYGSERLEVALRNFFGAELGTLQFYVAVATPNLIRLLACPPVGEDTAQEEESLTGMVVEHVQEAILQIRDYLDLEMRIVNIRVLKNPVVLAQQP